MQHWKTRYRRSRHVHCRASRQCMPQTIPLQLERCQYGALSAAAQATLPATLCGLAATPCSLVSMPKALALLAVLNGQATLLPVLHERPNVPQLCLACHGSDTADQLCLDFSPRQVSACASAVAP